MIGALLLTILAVAANVGDVITTERGLALGAKEGNPVAKWLFDHVGFRAAYILKGLMTLGLAYVWFNYSVGTYCLAAGAMTATGAYATWHNYGIIQRRLAKRAGSV